MASVGQAVLKRGEWEFEAHHRERSAAVTLVERSDGRPTCPITGLSGPRRPRFQRAQLQTWAWTSLDTSYS